MAASWVWGAEHEIVSFCEIEPFAQKVLKKHWPDVPVHDDIKTLSRGNHQKIDLMTGGFPCQDIAVCGKQDGINGSRSGLWKEYLRVLSEDRPSFAIVENSTNLLAGDRGRWFGTVLRDLASIGYNAEWYCIPASFFGFIHTRKRIFIIAYPNSANVEGLDIPKSILAHKKKPCRRELARAIDAFIPADDYAAGRGTYDGVSQSMDRLKGLGNAIVPQVVVPIMEAIKKISWVNIGGQEWKK